MTMHALSHARFRAPRSSKIRRTLLRLMPYRLASAVAVSPAKYRLVMASGSLAASRLLSHLSDGGADWTADGPL